MATIKSYTDIEQSKKLADILPHNTADNTWERVAIAGSNLNVPEELQYVHNGNMPFCFYSGIGVPCWSLAVLLDVLPLSIYDELDDRDYELKIDMADKMPRYVRLCDVYHSQFPYDFEKDTLLDNVVESIIWLNDNNIKWK
jgi:hypothetical protein